MVSRMKSHLNLLPITYRRGQLIRRRLAQWCAIWSLAIVTFSSLAWFEWSHYRSGLARLESLQREYEPTAKLLAATKGIQAKLDDLQRRESLALTLADEQSLLALIGVLSQAANKCDGQVSIAALAIDHQRQGEEDTSVMTINGIAVDDLAVAQFAALLRDRNTFANVELKSTGLGQVQGVAARTYSLECRF